MVVKAEVVVMEEVVVKEAVVRAVAAVVSQADPPRRGAKAGKCKPSAFFFPSTVNTLIVNILVNPFGTDLQYPR